MLEQTIKKQFLPFAIQAAMNQEVFQINFKQSSHRLNFSIATNQRGYLPLPYITYWHSSMVKKRQLKLIERPNVDGFSFLFSPSFLSSLSLVTLTVRKHKIVVRKVKEEDADHLNEFESSYQFATSPQVCFCPQLFFFSLFFTLLVCVLARFNRKWNINDSLSFPILC